MKKLSRTAVLALLLVGALSHAREIALTFDDAPTPDSALMTGAERTQRLISALKAAEVPDALFFVQGNYINEDTQKRLSQYANAGFHIANHSHTHQSASALGSLDYLADAYKAHLLLKDQRNFLPFHRFPYLHTGRDAPSILFIRQSLSELGYKDGYITVGPYDWHINSLLNKAAESNKKIDYDKASAFYVKTFYDAIEYYDRLARKTLGRSPRHILLLHENDAAALFAGDLVSHLRSKGWKIVSPQVAYQDPIATDTSDVAYYRQNRLTALADHKGTPEDSLVHVSENVEHLNKAFAEAGIVIE